MKLHKSLMLACVLISSSSVSLAQEKIITHAELPKKSQSFIKMYYPNEKVVKVEEDKEWVLFKTYEVKFESGLKLEFDSKGDWKEVEAKKAAVPYKIIPAKILQYITKSFPANKIVQISRDNKKYEVELTNGLDLEFNNKGQFVRIDD